ncbi:MAG: hypothetical protein M1827_002199 [Pycnora praestabilis]|nr:MAG: hypothetical protein M1827_002199 [Pycnora praestabilis]
MAEQSSSSSKSIAAHLLYHLVEYFDPSGIFPLLSPELLSRLPLRNLHWKSPSRPLRSISSLHIDLVQNSQSQKDVRPGSSSSSSTLKRLNTGDSSVDVDNAGSATSEHSQDYAGPRPAPQTESRSYKDPPKERRHQIPGLRQTPYLKVFFLRCDDNETYKGSSRKALREWIKEYTPLSQGTTSFNGQENHDASEWLIIHVVIPDTVAAAQPRYSGSSGGSTGNGTEKIASTSRWPGRGSNTIFEKIRADFNGSGKYSRDRVGQIRVAKGPDATSGVASAHPESPQERENAWVDVVTKMKSLILTSFDLRVGQYEEDIRQKDSQRSLPGWNFCTFFVLKEGLARGFENVGLVEDALVGYDELAVGLDAIVREQASGASSGSHGGQFLMYTEDLWRQLENAIGDRERQLSQHISQGTEAKIEKNNHQRDVSEPSLEDRLEGSILDAGRKKYRDLILSNDISVFDFRSYVFARQASLLLRIGNPASSRSELMAKLRTHPAADRSEYAFQTDAHTDLAASKASRESEDLMTLTEVCRRSLEFSTSVARVMRTDIQTAYLRNMLRRPSNEGETAKDEDCLAPAREISNIIGNIVSSWIFSLSQQILEQTSSSALPIPSSALPESNRSGEKVILQSTTGQEQKVSLPEPKTMMHPARTTSLPSRSPSIPGPLSPGVFQSRLLRPGVDQRNSDSIVTEDGRFTGFLKTGLEDLAASRAELFLLGRSVLETLGRQRGWFVGWDHFTNRNLSTGEDLQEVPLVGNYTIELDKEQRDDVETIPIVTLHGINDRLLIAALDSKEEFYELYETLTDKALRHYTVANRERSREKVLANMAALKYHQGDYATAAAYFHRMAPVFAEKRWNLVETSMLKMYAHCLKELNRGDEYIRVVLKLLRKAASREKAEIHRRGGVHVGSMNVESANLDSWLDDDVIETGGYVKDLFTYSKESQHEVSTPMSWYFTDISVDPFPQHYSDKDGFQLSLRMRYLLEERLEIRNAKLRIVGTVGGQSRDIWLESEESITMKRGIITLLVGTNASIPGSYIVDKILLQAPNLVFTHETLSKTAPSTPSGFSGSLSAAAVAAVKTSRILYYTQPSALDAKLSLSKYIHLERTRSIEIEISSGWNRISRGELRLRSASAGLRLHTAEAEIIDGNPTLASNKRGGIIDFENFPEGTSARFRVPYGLENDRSDLSIKMEVAYTTEKGGFLFAANPTISITLPLGVNVQDIFKETSLFARFTISTATPVPMHAISSKLEGSDDFEAKSASTTLTPMIIFPKQPVSLIYKITRRNELQSEPFAKKKLQKPLSLAVKYQLLDEEITDAVQWTFMSALTNSPFIRFYRLLLPVVLSGVQRRLDASELETVGLLNEVELGPFEDMRWDATLEGLPAQKKLEVETWLKQWHKRHSTIYLSDYEAPRQPNYAPCREIVIPFDFPHIQLLHTIDLRLLNASGPHSRMAAVGHILVAELCIRHTRRWDTRLNDPKLQAGSRLEFSYEIQANPEIWLEHELLTFPVTLLPLRPGHHLLPSIEIRSHLPKQPPQDDPNVNSSLQSSSQAQVLRKMATPASLGVANQSGLRSNEPYAESRRSSSTPSPTITCETDYRNQGETILILPDVSSTTISLDPGGPGGGAWLLSSERRGPEIVEGSE